MQFHIVTLFPDAFDSYLNESIIKRAQEKKKIKIKLYNPRDFTEDKHRRVDDKPYGGGPGMVMQALPILKAVEKVKAKKAKVIILSPRGKQFTNADAQKLSSFKGDIVLISGRYEGIDARVKKILKAEEISVGPYTLTGGELPAMVLIDAISRHIPGVLGNQSSVEESRVASGETYTRPETLVYKKKKYSVPKVLVSGHHGEIEKWRKGK
ncbi:MAG: tRNA (guanosine(37)-N1)-methyltransferase TrmD [Patescibacteria group bacterium]|nr:tRNA (guanosine(37)-N1)-methyltransferase TrmD [bacterium]MDZ4240582.1 tRNA (guanosine(37)-N1)-methyltransferase TrmD [Patescibacteria group bacterium]